MTLSCNQIIALAAEAAHSPGKITQGQQLLNSVLSDLAQIYDCAPARGQYVFNFDPSVTAPLPLPQTPASQFGSGPYFMPADYLRLSGSSGSVGAQRSFLWWLNGVPYPVIPSDLAEFDLQVQQSGLQSYVWLGATDMATPVDDRILLTTTGNVTFAGTTVSGLASTSRLIGGNALGISGQGIVPGTTIASVNAGAGTLTLSRAAILNLEGASLLMGYPPTIWIYPPPSSAQLAQIRYQRRMPPIVDFTRYPWFDCDGYLLKELQARYGDLNDDTRAATHHAEAKAMLTLWLGSKDDDQSHPKTVQLDRRRFGQNWRDLKTTKTVGWC